MLRGCPFSPSRPSDIDGESGRRARAARATMGRMTTRVPDRGGRPASTSAHRLAAAAQQLLVAQGFDATTVDQIAAAAGVSGRTFFRYFASKADVLWVESDDELRRVAQILAAPSGPTARADIEHAIRTVLDYPPQDEQWARQRAQLILTEPSVAANMNDLNRRWRAVVSEYVVTRTGLAARDIRVRVYCATAISAMTLAHEIWVDDETLSFADALHDTMKRMLPEEP